MGTSSYVTALVFAFMLLPLKGTGQNISERDFLGDWMFDYEASLGLMDAQGRQHYEKMGATRQDKVRQAYQGRRITFEPDGRFSQELANGKTVEGVWAFGKGRSIDITSPSGRTISFMIKKSEGNTLILVPKKPGDRDANMLFSQWYLIRG